MGLAKPPTRGPYGVDALSHSPQGWFARSALGRHVRGCKWKDNASALVRLHLAASRRVLDKPGYGRPLSNRLESCHSEIKHRAGSENAARLAGADGQNQLGSKLLGRRGHSQRTARPGIAERRWLFGNDRLRSRCPACEIE